jgi:hypothetical protein
MKATHTKEKAKLHKEHKVEKSTTTTHTFTSTRAYCLFRLKHPPERWTDCETEELLLLFRAGIIEIEPARTHAHTRTHIHAHTHARARTLQRTQLKADKMLLQETLFRKIRCNIPRPPPRTHAHTHTRTHTPPPPPPPATTDRCLTSVQLYSNSTSVAWTAPSMSDSSTVDLMLPSNW